MRWSKGPDGPNSRNKAAAAAAAAAVARKDEQVGAKSGSGGGGVAAPKGVGGATGEGAVAGKSAK